MKQFTQARFPRALNTCLFKLLVDVYFETFRKEAINLLQSQVNYWQLQEQKRHNRVDESNRSRELDLRQRDITNQERSTGVAQQQADIASVQAYTQQFDAETRRQQADVAKEQLVLNKAQFGLQEREVASKEKQSEAAQKQAAVAYLNYLNQSDKTQADIGKVEAETGKIQQETELKELETDFYLPGKVVDMGSTIVGTLAKPLKGLINKFSRTK